MKVTKLNNYEENYEKRVTEARNREIALLRRELAIWATTLFITVVSPMLASASTFAVYVLIDEANVLTAAKTFAVLLLFNALRFPINYAGRLIGSKSSNARLNTETFAIGCSHFVSSLSLQRLRKHCRPWSASRCF
jgi:hypothetical protein